MTEQELIEAFVTKKTLFAIFWGQITEVEIIELETVLIDDSFEKFSNYINKIIVKIRRVVSEKTFKISSDKLFASIESLKEFYNL